MADRELPLTARVGEAIGAPQLERDYLLAFGHTRILDGIDMLLRDRTPTDRQC